MKILTNEYFCNTPNLKKPAKGGPANFARLFFNFLKKKDKNLEWQGLIIDDLNQNKEVLSLRTLENDRKRSIFYFSLPFLLTEKIRKAKKIIDYRQVLKEPIDKLTSLIKKKSPDLVFLNGFSMGNWLILEAARKNNLPVIIQHAGIWFKELDIYKDFYSSAGVKMMKQMEKDSSIFSDEEIFLNDFSRSYFDQKVLKGKRAKNNKFSIIPLPVDFSFFEKLELKKTKFNFDKNKFNIGVIARWDRIKNHEAIAKLAVEIKKNNLPWKINSVTRIPVSMINKNIKETYQKNVNIIDFLTKKEIKDFCLANDLIVIPSHFDVSPTVLLEAIACQIPVAISSKVGFVDDYYDCGAQKWIIEFNNSRLALESLKKIKGKKLPTKLTRKLIEKHNLEKVFERYFSLLTKFKK